MKKMKKNGAVLIIALWILSMLVLLAISIGRRTSIELRLLKYHLSRSQAFHLARAAIERIYAEKSIDKNENYDTLNEDWSNKLKADEEPLFKDFPLGNGTFTLKYNQADYYGMQDESSKLNINKIINDKGETDKNRKEEFINLIKKVLPEKDTRAQEIAERFIDWIDKDNQKETFSNGEIQAKNAPLDRLEELTMIDDFISIEDVNKLSGYITIYGDGSININTAPREALIALGFSESEADDTIKCRNGGDGKAATDDDTIFLTAEEFIKTKILENNDAENAIRNRLCAASSYYSANSSAEVNGVKKEISAVINFNQDNAPKYLYWYED